MLSLYIHIPYCVRKCRYCGFYSTPYSPRNADNFISALQIEAECNKENLYNRLINTIYIGGGTPTVLSVDEFERVIGIIRQYFQIDDSAEFTVEANPNTVTIRCLAFLIEAGVNRLSLGVQSFSDKTLHALGRLHNAEQAVDAFELARKAGFSNIGIDLIYGIPGQTTAEWEETLNAVTALKPEHVSPTASPSMRARSSYSRQMQGGLHCLMTRSSPKCMNSRFKS